MQESREVYDGIISVLERGSEVSVRILEQLLTSGEVILFLLIKVGIQSYKTILFSNF